MNDSAMKTQVVTVQFTKGDSVLLSHAQVMPGDTPDQDEIRWLFNMPQIASQNGLEVPEKGESEYFASSESERDALAEQILDAVNAGRDKAEQLKAQVASAFAGALPKPTPEPQPEARTAEVPSPQPAQ